MTIAAPRHFLDLDVLETGTLRRILDMGAAFKAKRPLGGDAKPLAGKTLAMIFEKPSTRTRVSFEVGIRQLGGEAVILSHLDTQLGRGESIGDTARVLSRYCDAIMLRTNRADNLAELVRHATVPVINGLTDLSHPCQVMADVMTIEERKGDIAGKVVAWTGDGNNVAASWIHAAKRFAFELRLACPEPLRPHADVLAWAKREGTRIQLLTDPDAAVRGADAVVTDTWVSMDQEGTARDNREKRHNLLAPYRVDERLMGLAKLDAIFLHCLPAHRGEEVTAAVIDGPQSAVWDEAENRLHVQKGILAWCMA
jgi:ornithine carbamoyltransferase